MSFIPFFHFLEFAWVSVVGAEVKEESDQNTNGREVPFSDMN